MDEVEITPEMSDGDDEMLAEFYKCPKCGDAYILRRFNYCPNCGVKLRHIAADVPQEGSKDDAG